VGTSGAALPGPLVPEERSPVRRQPLNDALLHVLGHHEVGDLLCEMLVLRATPVKPVGVLARRRRVHVEKSVVPLRNCGREGAVAHHRCPRVLAGVTSGDWRVLAACSLIDEAL